MPTTNVDAGFHDKAYASNLPGLWHMATTERIDRSEDVCHSVLEAVAACRDVDILDIDEPLQQTIDGDSLAALWGTRARQPGVHGELEFDYYGCRVRVSSDGEVEAERL